VGAVQQQLLNCCLRGLQLSHYHISRVTLESKPWLPTPSLDGDSCRVPTQYKLVQCSFCTWLVHHLLVVRQQNELQACQHGPGQLSRASHPPSRLKLSQLMPQYDILESRADKEMYRTSPYSLMCLSHVWCIFQEHVIQQPARQKLSGTCKGLRLLALNVNLQKCDMTVTP